MERRKPCRARRRDLREEPDRDEDEKLVRHCGDRFLGNVPDPGCLEIATIAEAGEQAVVALGLPFPQIAMERLGLSIRWSARAF